LLGLDDVFAPDVGKAFACHGLGTLCRVFAIEELVSECRARGDRALEIGPLSIWKVSFGNMMMLLA
jgi:hypothetical protein